MRIASRGHAAFAATMIALGILGLVQGNFTPVWAPVPKDLPARELLAYLCALISLMSGVGLLWRRTAATAARVLFVYLVLWLLLLRLRDVFPAPAVMGSWYGFAETTVIVAAAWVLYVWFAAGWDRQQLGFATGDRSLQVARVLYGAAITFFGASHFVYVELTTPLVPSWLPAHLFWAWFTGCAYIAAGASVIVGVFARLAATLSAIQMGLFTLLVWVPALMAGPDPSKWSEFTVSCAITAGAWVLADSYRGPPGLRNASKPEY